MTILQRVAAPGLCRIATFPITNNVIARTNGIAVFLAVAIAGIPVRGDDVGPDAQILVDAVIEGIEANYSFVETLEAEFIQSVELRGVTERSSTTNQGLGGSSTQLTFDVAPHSEWRCRQMLNGDKLLFEITNSETKATETVVFDGARWLNWRPDLKTAWYNFETEPNRVWGVDLRWVSSIDSRLTIPALLRASEIRSVENEPSAAGGEMIQVRCLTPGGQVLTMDFSSEVSFLPMKAVLCSVDGWVGAVFQFEYLPLLNRKAWLVREATCRRFAPEAVREPDSEEWTELQTLRVNEPVQCNRVVDTSIFSPQLPLGTIVHDNVNHKKFVVGVTSPDGQPAVQSGSRRWTLVMLNIALVVVVAAIVAVRRFRQS